MRIAGILTDSIVDGDGVRDVIFLQGCRRACKGCHNPDTLDLCGGEEVPLETITERLKGTSNSITISGGEPLLQYDELLELLYLLKTQDVWLYTGYTFEDIPNHIKLGLLPFVQVIVDGAFEEDKKNSELRFRGSENQRLIDLRESMKNGITILWEEDE